MQLSINVSKPTPSPLHKYSHTKMLFGLFILNVTGRNIYVQKPNDKNSECSAFRFLTQRASLWR
jgi:hypothetical protein